MKKYKLLYLSIILGALFTMVFASCKKQDKEESSTITVTTKSVTEITNNSAKCGGIVTISGNISVSNCGICWSKSPNPTTNDFYSIITNGPGNFFAIMINLEPNTIYYIRAYATLSSSSIMYGDEKSFTTLSDSSVPISVSTNDIIDITSSSAISGGYVTINNKTTVVARGVCYGTSRYPSLDNAHTLDGQGTGAFTSNITGLIPNTIYYVRAYASSDSGATIYGNEKEFVTQNGGGSQGELPIVITNEVTEITGSSARCGGEVTYDGGSAITARGICWSSSPNPTLTNSSAFSGMGTGPFVSQMSDLEIETTYYVKAYATNSVGTAYGNAVSFKTKGLPPQGAINGLFSVSDTKKVYFSQGNLQYQASTNTWRFAEHQWDFIGGPYGYDPDIYQSGNVTGSDNTQISPTYSGWIDLLGWGTSGRNHGAICYQPWSTSQNSENYYAYGSPNNHLNDFTGEADWGCNAISNGGNQNGVWRTLTQSEWEYLLFSRTTPSGMRFAHAKINVSNSEGGIIILPNDWDVLNYSLINVNSIISETHDNVISLADWISIFQSNGAVFLPLGLPRYGNTLSEFEFLYEPCYYWSSTSSVNVSAESVHFSNYGGPEFIEKNKHIGAFVRLVSDY